MKYEIAQVCVNVGGDKGQQATKYVTPPEYALLVESHAPEGPDGDKSFADVIDLSRSAGVVPDSFLEEVPAKLLTDLRGRYGRSCDDMYNSDRDMPKTFEELDYGFKLPSQPKPKAKPKAAVAPKPAPKPE